MRKNHCKAGFTLVELMMVLVIIGILVAIVVPVYGSVSGGAAKSACLANQRTIEGALLQYSFENPDEEIDKVEKLFPAYLNEAHPNCKSGCIYSIDWKNKQVILEKDKGDSTHWLHYSDEEKL